MRTSGRAAMCDQDILTLRTRIGSARRPAMGWQAGTRDREGDYSIQRAGYTASMGGQRRGRGVAGGTRNHG